jgi:hypothetical protein
MTFFREIALSRSQTTSCNQGEKMKRMLFAILAAAVLGFGGFAAAQDGRGPVSGPAQSAQYEEGWHHYDVYFRTCPCDGWRLYGCFDCPCAALTAVRSLRMSGYQAYIANRY